MKRYIVITDIIEGKTGFLFKSHEGEYYTQPAENTLQSPILFLTKKAAEETLDGLLHKIAKTCRIADVDINDEIKDKDDTEKDRLLQSFDDIQKSLDTIGLFIASKGMSWSDEARHAYERATKTLNDEKGRAR